MKNLTRILLCAAMLATAFAARAERTFNQAELDALLAPVALYPDTVLSNILVAASYPDDVREAAAWSRGNPQLRGDEALGLVQNLPWQPSVKALVAAPEVLARMDESPNWLHDLGEAYRVHGPYVMETVQALRQRAQAHGYPPSEIAPAPSPAGVVYVRYYDPYVVYGPWWWPAYRPIVWRPFAPLVVISRPVYVHGPAYVHRPVYVNRPVVVHRPVVVRGPTVVQGPVVRAQFQNAPEPRRSNGPPSPAAKLQQQPSQTYHRIPESQRQPIVRPQSQPQSQGQGVFRASESRGRPQQQQHRNDRHRG